MVDEQKYLNSINNYMKRNMKKDKILNGVVSDMKNGKISIETFDKALNVLYAKSNNKEITEITDLKTRIKVITNPKKQKEILEKSKENHKIDVLDIGNNER